MTQAALQVLSNFSFLTGASHPEELVTQAKQLGLSALAITDDCSLSGAVRAHLAAKEAGLQLLIGARFDVQRSQPMPLRSAPDERPRGLDAGLELASMPADRGPLFRLLLLAPELDAYGNLSQFITDLRCAAPKGSYRLDWRGIQPQLLGGLLAIALPSRRARDAELLGIGRWLLKHFAGRAWLGVDLRQQLDDARWLQRLRWLAEETALPLVAAPQVLMHRAQRKPLQDAMTAIRLRRPLADCGYGLEPNAGAHLQRLAAPYQPEWIAETLAIAARCRFSLGRDPLPVPGRSGARRQHAGRGTGAIDARGRGAALARGRAGTHPGPAAPRAGLDCRAALRALLPHRGRHRRLRARPRHPLPGPWLGGQ